MRYRFVLPAVAAIVLGIVTWWPSGGESATQEKVELENGASVYTTTPAAAEVFLARFRPPSGFRRSQRAWACERPEPERACFARERSVVPTDASWTKLLKSYGVTILYQFDPARCRMGHPRRNPLTFAHCTAAAELHGVRLLFSETSLVAVHGARMMGTAAKIPLGPRGPRVVGGTQIEITDIGTYNARCSRAAEESENVPGCR